MEIGTKVKHKDGTIGVVIAISENVATVKKIPLQPVIEVEGHRIGAISKKPLYEIFIADVKNLKQWIKQK